MSDDRETLWSDDSRIDAILGEWQARRDAGAAESQDELIAAHPDLADSLRARFDALSALSVLSAAKQPSLRSVHAGRYADFRVLGAGGMGIVYWALDTDLNRQVAFKVVRPDAGLSGGPAPGAPLALSPPGRDTPASSAFATLKARFLQEAWVTAGLEHPGIVPVYEVGETPEGVPYYTMRFVRGSRTFAAAIEAARDRGIDARLALLEPFLKVCDTIRYAHAGGVIHRDLKPENVALGEFGEAVVLDWGLAKMTGRPDAFAETWQHRLQEYRDAADLRTMASALGTPGFMAPEAALGRTAEVDARSDVYSLGAMLFQVLTGRLPYEFRSYAELVMHLMGEDPPAAASLDASVPAELSAIAARALARDRAARTPSVDALVVEIRGWVAAQAQDRELAALREQAKAAFDAADPLTGDLRLRQLDRAASACDQILAKRGDDPAATSLRRDIDALRERGVSERATASRRTALRRVGVAALVFLVVAGAAVGKVLTDQRDQARTAERDKGAALRRVEEERQRTADALERERTALADAREQARRARAVGLAHASGEAVGRDPALGLRLAREAARLEDRLETGTALRAALGDSFECARLGGHDEWVTCVAASPDAARTVTASFDCTEARVWATGTGAMIGTLRGHDGPIWQVSYAADGTRILTASFDKTARIWDAATGLETVVLRGHAGRLFSASFSPDGAKVVTGSDDGTARLWDAASGRTLGVMGGHTAGTVHSRFSPDGTRVLTHSGSDTTAQVWDAATCRRLTVLRGHAEGIRSATFSPDGSSVLTSSSDATARVWNADSGAETMVLRGHAGALNSAGFSPLGDVILTASDDRTARLWLTATGEVFDVIAGHESGVGHAVFSHDGTRILTWADDASIRLWDGLPSPRDSALRAMLFSTGIERSGRGDWRRRELAVLRGHAGPVVTAQFTRDGTTVISAARDTTARVWDVGAPRELPVIRGHASDVTSATYSSDGTRVLTASWDRTARVWDAATGRAILVLPGHGEAVDCAAFSLDGTRIVTSSSKDGSARVWDASTGRQISVLRPHAGPATGAVLSRDGTRIVTLNGDATASLWDTGTGDRVATFAGEECAAEFALFSPDGKSILTASRNDSAHLWESSTGRPLVTFADSTFNDAAFSSDGRRIVEACEGGARIWDAATGKVLVNLRGHDGWCDHAAFAGDDARVVTAGADHVARVWDASSGRELCALVGHTEALRAAAFSPDGRTIATAGGADRTARLWDAATGRQLAVLGGHAGDVTSAEFSRDGTRVLTASADGTARQWYVRTSDLLALADTRITRDFSAYELALYDEILPEETKARARASRADETDARSDVRTLAEFAWNAVVAPGSTRSEYERALRRAARAVELAPDDIAILNTLGVAQYRCGRFEDAIATLRRCDEANARSAAGAQPSDVAFLAMALHQLGRASEAAAQMTRLRDLTSKAPHSDDAGAKAFLAEAETLTGGAK